MSSPPFLSIDDARSFIGQNPPIYLALKTLIDHSIIAKKISFSKEKFQAEYSELKPFNLIGNDQEEVFLLDFTSPIFGSVLLEKAESVLQEKAPTDPEACFAFADRFGQEIRKPKLNHHWYSDLVIQLESFLLVWLHQKYDVDVTRFVGSITEEEWEQKPWLNSLDFAYMHSFAYLSDPPELRHETIVNMLASVRTKDSAYEALRNLGKVNPKAADQLYEYGRTQKAFEFDGYLPNLLHGLYSGNQTHYLQEAINLFDISPLQSLLCLTWFDYTDGNQIRTAFDFLIKQTITDISYLRSALVFYIRLIDNGNTPADLVPLCFQQIKEFSKSTDEQLRGQLIWRTRMITGYDEEKYQLIPYFTDWGNPMVLNDYFNKFTSPVYLFRLIRNLFLAKGMRANISIHKDSLQYQYFLHKKAFEKELVTLLSDDLAIIRFAGMQVLMSPSGGVYDLNLVEMEERVQIRIIETLLPTPINIEDILPLVLQLRNGAFEAVRQALQKGLIDLIQAYDHNLVDMVRNIVDPTKDNDKQLLEALEKAYGAYKEEQDRKKSINEFDPRLNEFRHIDLYYRLEVEQNAEAMEAAQGKSVFAQIAKKTIILRGSGYEGHQGELAQLQEFSVSRLIDKRLYINPDKFEWDFQQNATGNNYTTNPEK
jgi:hypothetical protein